ncbi:flagellar hook-associated protein 2 [Bryocella elongata]|uniref:Flagellar hook-associated protein 2 n=1 Tax=Bryocella elongata TaxID=863522 RepID=A0A1H5TKW1_9BACT|nr:flagellar filament capping protein FliD [Bryocella elongata]SEF63420.1 flagellar hook-associated protein 2 [Bryocella elongata]
MSSSSVTAATTTNNSTYDYSSLLQAATGASSAGIDVTAAVAAAVAAARGPETAWKSEQTTLTNQTSELTAMQTATTAIQTDMESLNTLTGPLATRDVTSSNSNVVTATAASGTVAGTHTVVVNNVATTGAWYSDLSASSSSTLPSTSFTITMASGSSATISTATSGDNTLAGLAAAINTATDSSGKSLGVTASVISDSTGSRLAIVSNSSGSADDFSISSTNFSGTSWTTPDLPTGETLGANTLTVTVGGTATNFTTTAGETYAQLATAINNAGIGVTATAGSDSNGSNLTLASSDGTTTFSVNQPTFGFTQAEAGANASVVVDGVPITSASNTVTGAISGVTLDLIGASTGGTTTLTVASDSTAVATAVNQFVTDYNTAVGLVNKQFEFSSTTGTEGDLASDPTVIGLQSALQSALNYTYTPSSGTTTVSSLSDLGITQGTDGTLSVDSTTLDAALVNTPGDVQSFFQGASLNGFAANMNNSLSLYLNPGDGAFTLELSSITTQQSDLTSEISNFETNYITPLQTQLTTDLGTAEAALEELPTQMAQINAMLGLTGKSS